MTRNTLTDSVGNLVERLHPHDRLQHTTDRMTKGAQHVAHTGGRVMRSKRLPLLVGATSIVALLVGAMMWRRHRTN